MPKKNKPTVVKDGVDFSKFRTMPGAKEVDVVEDVVMNESLLDDNLSSSKDTSKKNK